MPPLIFDDYAGNTSTLGLVSVGSSSNGVVETIGDRDWFRLALNAGVSYRFNLNGNGLSDPTLALRDAAGVLLAFNDDANGSLNSQIDYMASANGTVYLDAGSFGTGLGSYNLVATNVTVDDFSADYFTTGSLNVGGNTTGVVGASGDRDWFRLDLNAGVSYRFNLNGNGLSDPTLALRDAAGVLLAFNDDANGTLNSQIDYTASANGTVYLDAGSFGTGLGSYNLVATNVTVDDFSADYFTTGSLNVGGNTTGVVGASGDRDWFRLDLNAGVSYRFNLNGNGLSDPTLALRDAAGVLLAFNDDANGTLNSQIDYTASANGTVYLDAGSFGTGLGSYNLVATNVTVDDFAADSSTIGSLSVGGSTTGVVGASGDRDWFRVALNAGGTYRFNLNGIGLSDPTLYLRDANGLQLAFNDDANAGLNSQIEFTATSTGTYYLDAGAFGLALGSYSLGVTTLGFVGTAGNDGLIGGLGNDVFQGSVGNDNIVGGSGLDEANYSSMSGPVTLGAFGVLNKGALGIDRLDGIETIVGSAGVGDTVDHSAATAPATGTSTNLETGAVVVNGTARPLPLSFTVRQFENVTGSAFDDSITGDRGNNILRGGLGNDILTGGLGNDTLDGGAGNDTLIGGLGTDTLTGGLGADRFRFDALAPANLDRITDFNVAQRDTIALNAAVFLGIGVSGATLAASQFRAGAGVLSANSLTQRILLNTTTGGLYWDRDGSAGAFTAVQFATLAPVAAGMTSNQFVLV